MKVGSSWMLVLVVMAGCSSSHPLDDPDAAAGSSDALVDGGQPSQGVDCGPPMQFAPCRVDSDCHSAYLVCVAPDYATLTVCRDPNEPESDAGVDPACPTFAELATAPICPQSVRVTSSVCEIRYQRDCATDADCGPAFVCSGSRCQQASSAVACATAADCPAEWDCAAPCACTAGAPKSCLPPFAEFHCPACSP
jgi:hypothetical protein